MYVGILGERQRKPMGQVISHCEVVIELPAGEQTLAAICTPSKKVYIAFENYLISTDTTLWQDYIFLSFSKAIYTVWFCRLLKYFRNSKNSWKFYLFCELRTVFNESFVKKGYSSYRLNKYRFHFLGRNLLSHVCVAVVSPCECDYTYLKSYIFHFALSTVCDVVSVYTFILHSALPHSTPLHSTRGGG